MKDLTIKFYDQPENGEKIGLSILDSNSGFSDYIFKNNLDKVDFTYREQVTFNANSVMAFNSDMSMLSTFNTLGVIGSTSPAGVTYDDLTPGIIYDADTDGATTMIVGSFHRYNGYSSKYITNISRDGLTLSAFANSFGGPIQCVRRHPGTGGYWIIGGSANLHNGSTSIYGISRLTSSMTIDIPFNNNILASGILTAYSQVTKVEICSATNKIYVGFTNSTGGLYGRVVRFNTDGTHDASFTQVSCTNATVGGAVYIRSIAIDYSMGYVLIGGNFEECNGTSRRIVAKVSTSGTLLPFLNLVGGTDCKAITTSEYDTRTWLAVNSTEVTQDSIGATPYDITGKGIIQVDAYDGEVNSTFLSRIGKGIRCNSTNSSICIKDIKEVRIWNEYDDITLPSARDTRTQLMIGGQFNTFAEFRAEHFASFDLQKNYENVWLDEYNGVPVIDTIKIPYEGDYPYYVNKIIASNLSQGGTVHQYCNNFQVFGSFDFIRGMKSYNQFTPSGSAPYGVFSEVKEIEIGQYKSNVNSVTFTFDTSNENEGDVGLAIFNSYNPYTNAFAVIGELFEFRYEPNPGQIQIEGVLGQTIINFITELQIRLETYFNDLKYYTADNTQAGWRDFYYTITSDTGGTGIASVTLTLNNQIWDNPILTTHYFPGVTDYIITSTTVGINLRSSLADTFWNTHKKLNYGYLENNDDLIGDGGIIKYRTVTNAAFSTDTEFGAGSVNGSEIHLEFSNTSPTRLFKFYNLIQLFNEIEMYSVEQIIYDMDQFLVRSPSFVKSPGLTQSSSLFDITTYEGNIEQSFPISYSFTKQKITSQQNKLYIDISNIVKEDLEADLTGFVSTTTPLRLGMDESRWVRVEIQDYNNGLTGSYYSKYYHVMDGYVSPIDENFKGSIPRILTPKRNYVSRNSSPRLYYYNKDLVAISITIYEGWDWDTNSPIYFLTTVEPNEFISQNRELYNSLHMATYMGLNEEVTITFLYTDDTTETVVYTIYDDCLYDNYDLVFKNKYGVLETLSMSKKTTKQLNVEGKDYLRSIVDINGNYDIRRHTNKQYNVSGYEEWTLNTPFIPEYMNESIKQAMLSEEMWIRPGATLIEGVLTPSQTLYPVVRMDQSLSYKTSLNDKLIQYTIKVKLSHNEIKNIL